MPAVLSGSLILFGLIIAARSLVFDGPPIEPTRWRPTLLVLAVIAVFVLLIQRAGFAPAVLVATILAAWATVEVRRVESVVLGLAMTVFCVAVFIYGLRLPFPVFAGSAAPLKSRADA